MNRAKSLQIERIDRLFVVALATVLILAEYRSAAAAELVLVEQGISRVPIVVSPEAPPRTREAVTVLADIIETISGARPEVLEGAPNPLPASAIWIGTQTPLAELFPEVNLEFQHPEEILITANRDHLLIAGRDRWNPQQLTVPGKDGKPVPKQQEAGTANAVYTFLQEQLGVRWLWPGELGIDVVRSDTIKVKPFEFRYYPQIRGRGGVFHFSSQLNTRGYGHSHEWTRLQRLQLDSLDMSGGHGFADWWDRYQKTHPEIFALQPDGTRSGFPNPRTVKLCMSNPLVGELWLKDVQHQLSEDPTQTVFNASPNDGWSSGHCVCENCSAWDHPDGEPRLFHWKNHREQRPALSDRDVTFANKMGELLKERFPDKDYRVLMMSYGHSRPAPVKARPADNVIMSIVANFFGRTGLVDRGSTRGDTYRQQFEAWAEIVPAMLWRPNTGSPAGWQQGLPDLHIAQTAKDLQDVAAANCQGIYIDSVWEHWATQGPQYYIMAQLAWNPEQNPDAILDDYYRRGFGPACDPVRAYFELWEQARAAHVAEHGEAGVFTFPRLYTAERLQAAEAHLKRAAEAVAGDPGPYVKRVELIRAGLTHTQLVVENISLMRRYWLEPDESLAAQVKRNWDALEKNCQAHPHAINWGPVRPNTPRMLGLHPEHPNPKLSLRQLRDLDLE
jgi:hypothetical protein